MLLLLAGERLGPAVLRQGIGLLPHTVLLGGVLLLLVGIWDETGGRSFMSVLVVGLYTR